MYVNAFMPNNFSIGQSKSVNPGQIGPFEHAPSDSKVLEDMEALLWAELLSHAGFEDALVRGAGGHASGFSRLILEHVAADLADAQPLGLKHELARAYDLNPQG